MLAEPHASSGPDSSKNTGYWPAAAEQRTGSSLRRCVTVSATSWFLRAQRGVLLPGRHLCSASSVEPGRPIKHEDWIVGPGDHWSIWNRVVTCWVRPPCSAMRGRARSELTVGRLGQRHDAGPVPIEQAGHSGTSTAAATTPDHAQLRYAHTSMRRLCGGNDKQSGT